GDESLSLRTLGVKMGKATDFCLGAVCPLFWRRLGEYRFYGVLVGAQGCSPQALRVVFLFLLFPSLVQYTEEKFPPRKAQARSIFWAFSRYGRLANTICSTYT